MERRTAGGDSLAGAGEVTLLLARAREGDASATARLLPLVYDHLRALAASYMRGERPEHSLQPTELVHEVFLKLAGGAAHNAQDRGHFFALAARAMRQVLVDHARAKQSAKRGGKRQRVTLEDSLGLADEATIAPLDLLDLDRALERLALLDPRQSQVVELRFFSGLGVGEVAAALGVSRRTVEADWTMAKAWLKRELRGE